MVPRLLSRLCMRHGVPWGPRLNCASLMPAQLLSLSTCQIGQFTWGANLSLLNARSTMSVKGTRSCSCAALMQCRWCNQSSPYGVFLLNPRSHPVRAPIPRTRSRGHCSAQTEETPLLGAIKTRGDKREHAFHVPGHKVTQRATLPSTSPARHVTLDH